jgi:hypothetical protein
MTLTSISIVSAFRAWPRWLMLLAVAATLLLQEGIRTSSASDDVPFELLRDDQCFMFSQLVPTRVEGNRTVRLPLELVINDEEHFRKLFDPQIVRCPDVDMSTAIPKVDFSKKTVLGLWSPGSCATTGFRRRVLRDDIQKTIIYSVAVVAGTFACSGPGHDSLNLIAIPQMPPGYKVVFETFHE